MFGSRLKYISRASHRRLFGWVGCDGYDRYIMDEAACPWWRRSRVVPRLVKCRPDDRKVIGAFLYLYIKEGVIENADY